MVLFDHAIVLGGFGSNAILGKTNMGTVAVYGFFGISGYLIAASATRNSVGRYLWQRALRILPAFWICLIVTAFFFGLIGWFHGNPRCGISCYVRASDGPLDFIARNSWLRLNQSNIADTLHGVPLPGPWNGSLWSLYYEFLCYLIVAALAATRLLRHRWAVAVLAAGVWALEIAITSVPSLNAQVNDFRNSSAFLMLALVPIFLAGSLLYLYRDEIRDSGVAALVCLGVFLISFVVPLGNHVPAYTLTSANLFAPVLIYPLLWLGIHLPLQRVGARNDYSYGVYIYAWPVSQLLALWGVYKWGYLVYALLIVLLTSPFAVASWWLIEKHALRLKKWTPRLGAPQVSEEAPSSAVAVSSALPLDE